MSFADLLGVKEGKDLDPLGLGSRVQSGFGSRGMFGPQVRDTTKNISAYDNPQDELSEYYKQMYEGINWGVVQNAPPIVANRIRANRSPIPNTRGRLDVSGGVSLQCNTRSMLPFIRHALMYPGTGTEGEDVTRKISPLTLTPSSDPALSQVSTTETWELKGSGSNLSIYKVGTDNADTLKALGGTGSGAVVGDAKKNGFEKANSAPPSQFEISVITTSAAGDLKTGSKLTFRGVDQNGTVLSETHSLDGTADKNAESGIISKTDSQIVVRTKFNYIETIPGDANWALRVTNVKDGVTPKTKIAAYVTTQKQTRRTLYEVYSAIINPLSVYIVKGGNPHLPDQHGGIPNVYAGCFINSLTLNVSETVMLDVDFIGRNGYTRVTPGHLDLYGRDWGRNHIPPDAFKADKAAAGKVGYTNAWEFLSPVNPVMTGWESGLQIKEPGQDEWTTVPCSDFNYTLTNNLTHNERYWLRRYHTEPTPSGAFDSMVNGTVDYRTAQGFDFLQQENIPVEARMICMSRDVGGKEHYIILHFGESVLNETVDPPVSGEDVITQSFTLKTLSKESGAQFAATRTFEDTLDVMTRRSPVVFEIASDQILAPDLIAAAA